MGETSSSLGSSLTIHLNVNVRASLSRSSASTVAVTTPSRTIGTGAMVTERMIGGWFGPALPDPIASVCDESKLHPISPKAARVITPMETYMTCTRSFDMRLHNLCASPDERRGEVKFSRINPADSSTSCNVLRRLEAEWPAYW